MQLVKVKFSKYGASQPQMSVVILSTVERLCEDFQQALALTRMCMLSSVDSKGLSDQTCEVLVADLRTSTHPSIDMVPVADVSADLAYINTPVN